MNRLFKVAMFFTAFIPLWITVLFLDVMSIADKSNIYIKSEVSDYFYRESLFFVRCEKYKIGIIYSIR